MYNIHLSIKDKHFFNDFHFEMCVMRHRLSDSLLAGSLQSSRPGGGFNIGILRTLVHFCVI